MTVCTGELEVHINCKTNITMNYFGDTVIMHTYMYNLYWNVASIPFIQGQFIAMASLTGTL